MKHEEMDQHLAETDLQIDRLHALYEQWFMGLEKRPPTKMREALEKRLALLRTNLPRNTAHRFRAQTLLQRWVTMTHHWNKVSKQIEEGTYYRDVARAKRKAAERDAVELRKAQKVAATKKAQDDVALQALAGWRLDERDLDDAFDSLFDDASLGPSPASDPFADEAPAAVVSRPLPAAASPSAVVPPPAAPGSSAAAPRPVVPPPLVAGSSASAARPAPPPPPRVSSAAAPRPVPPPPVASSAAAPRPAQPVASTASAPRPDVPQVYSTMTAARPEPSRGGELDYQSVYRKYVAARQQNNERVDNVKLESIVATIEKQLPELRKKHAGKAIDFEVVVRDGRVGLKPIAR